MTTPCDADRGDEREGEHDAAELGEHAGCGIHRRAHGAGLGQAEQRVADEGADDGADDGGEQRQPGGVPEGREHDGVAEGGHVVEREGAVRRRRSPEPIASTVGSGEEQQDVGGEGHEPEPGPAADRRAGAPGADPAAVPAAAGSVPAPSAGCARSEEVTGPPRPTSRRAACRRSCSAPRSGRPSRSGASGRAAASSCVDRAGLGHGLHADRACAALQPQVLHLVAVEELLPQARSGRVRGVHVDGLVVVAGVTGAGEDDDLPVGVVGLRARRSGSPSRRRPGSRRSRPSRW